MRILVCSEQPPIEPFEDGIRIPLDILLSHLQGHEVRVVSLFDPELDRPETDTRGIRLVARPRTGPVSDVTLVARAAITGRPLRADSLANRLRPALREEAERFHPDVVHVVAHSIAGVRDAVPHVPAILVAQDAWYRNVEALEQEATGLRRLVYRREVERVKRFEAREYARYEAVTFVSREDADAIASLRPGLPLHVVPNGVDATFFSPDPSTPARPLSIVFHGNLLYAPNAIAAKTLALEVFPLVEAELPEATLTIVGRRPEPGVRALARADGKVEIVADAEDIRPWLRRASVYAAPMTAGSGIKNKVLEALACELPAVVTRRALQGLEVVDDREVAISSDGPDEFAARLVEVLKSPADARQLGVRGRQYVLSAHDWSAVARRYEELYASVAQPAAQMPGTNASRSRR